MENDKYIGRLLDGRYEIIEVIGTGGMAVVYKARCHRLNRLVAIKILKDDYLQDEEFRRRFHAEGEAVAMLSHPNIVSVYDVSSSSQAEFIVMELIDGITLKQYMEKKGYLNWKETLHFAIQIAKALEHAHSRGIVHRDIKPHNVMVLKNGSVKVADFGIARVMSKSNTLTKEALGSVHYISPEQAKGGRVDNRSDIYSLGIVMYEMIAGRVPYDGESPVSVAIQHINGGAPKPSYFNPNIPVGLEQIIIKSIALAPGDRYDTATAMLYDMDEFRKNPEQLLQQQQSSPVGETVRAVQNQQAAKGSQGGAGSIAERTVKKKDSTPKSKGNAKSGKSKTVRRNTGHNRVATVALVACVVVSIVALIVLGLVIADDGETDPQPTVQMVRVPNLVGQNYYELEEYPGLRIEYQDGEYGSPEEKDKIIRQYPTEDTEVISGTLVYVTIGLGEPEEPLKTMDDLTGTELEEALRFLEGYKLNLNIEEPREEHHSEIPAGCVIRTEPAVGDALKEGQTVEIWVSTGPKTEMAEVPNVVGRDINKALQILEGNGFKNVVQNPVDSTAKKDTVVNQSAEEDKKIDINTEIILDVSTGVSNLPTEPEETESEDTEPEETQPEETEPEEPETEETTSPTEETLPENTVQLKYAFLIPSSTEQYELSIRIGEEVFLKAMTIQPGVSSVTIPLVGNGEITYDLYVNGEYLRSETVVFEPDE